MIDLFCGQGFDSTYEPWIAANTGGSGSVSTSGRVLTTVGSSPQRYCSYLVQPGETIEFSVKAICTGAAGGFISIDTVSKGSTWDAIEIPVANTWKNYKVTYTCPFSYLDGIEVFCVVGNLFATSTASTTAKFTDPAVKLIGAKNSKPPIRSLGTGMIRNISGSQGIHSGFFNHGVYSVTFSSTDVVIKLNHVYTDSASFAAKRPLVFCQASADAGFLTVLAGGVSLDTDDRLKFTLKYYDAAGVVINPTTTLNTYVQFNVLAP